MGKPLAGFLLVVVLSGCPPQGPQPNVQQNVVATFLNGAESQAETEGQQREIRRALIDMLEKNPSVLSEQRYADYQGRPNAWSVIDVLHRHFVPPQAMSLEPEAFYRDVRKLEAKKAIQKQLDQFPGEE